jgi:hypothetical protein
MPLKLTAAALLIFGTVGLFVDCRVAANRPILNDGSTVMKIEFKRSGGFSPITNASGTIEFTDSGAEVQAANGAYQRNLTPDEAAKLRSAADQTTSPASVPASQNDALRDGFQYDLTVTTKDGKSQTLKLNTAGPSSGLEALSAGSAHLLQWVQNESQRILAHKTAAR